MEVPKSFTDTFGLIIDSLYSDLLRVANLFAPGAELTTQQIITTLEKKYRKNSMPAEVWYDKVNKTIDAMVKYELLEYRDGFFYRTNFK